MNDNASLAFSPSRSAAGLGGLPQRLVSLLDKSHRLYIRVARLDELARRTVNEPDIASRIQMMYRRVFGRAAGENELRAGVQFLRTEPLASYEERKKEKDKKDSKPDAKPEPKPEPAKDAAARPGSVKADGMMSGVVPGAAPKPEEKMLPVTPWGRYAKVLLSSAEFVFVD